ncbi:MAG: hypothetical protein C5B49_05145 [Bdellovibrio sp.]|nr:MAG: hypothetical protein C5B49_05145 [Bdellovibrio sp.]
MNSQVEIQKPNGMQKPGQTKGEIPPLASFQSSPVLSLESGGYKLQSVEILNWGTFDRKIWKMETLGESALITGENGSGKSTLVDALLTLLVANNKRNYNLSSGSGKRERSEATYVRGAYGREKDPKGIEKTKFCRPEEGTYSVLIAQFGNRLLRDVYSLAQFFWYEKGELRKFFVTSQEALTIDGHFSGFQNSQELRKRLRSLHKTSVFDSFSDYQLNFMGYVGTKSLKAMDLFNQVVAIKEIGSLSEFVRKHMLEAQNVQELIDQLYMNYDNLNLSHQAILQARQQLELLEPIGEGAKQLKELEESRSGLEQEERKIPLYLNLQRKSILEEKLHKTSVDSERKNQEQIRIQEELGSVEERKNQLLIAINQDDSAKEIDRLRLLIKQQEELKRQKHKAYVEYEKLLGTLKLKPEPNLKSFTDCREKVKDLEFQFTEESRDLSEKIYQGRKESDVLDGQIHHLEEDLAHLKKVKGNVPIDHLKVREALCIELQVEKSTLPFVAELIQVKDSEKKKWNVSLEKVLRSFGLRILIPSDLYTKVNRYLSKNAIGIKLLYHKVDFHNPTSRLNDSARDRLFHKLDFHSRSPYVPWIKNQIVSDYDYVCTEDLATFQSSFRALMPSGLIKRGHSLHEKDDRGASSSARSLLGWDNASKLQEIQEHYTQYKNRRSELAAQMGKMEERSEELDRLKIHCRDVLNLGNYSALDWPFCEEEIDKLSQQKEKLGHHSVKQWQSDLDKLTEREKILRGQRDQILSDLGILKSQLKSLPQEIELCQLVIQKILETMSVDIHDPDLFTSVVKNLKRRKVVISEKSSEQLNLLQRDLSEELAKEKAACESKLSQVKTSLIKKMTQYKVKFPDLSGDLQPALEYLSDFLTVLEKVAKESLPEHEKRFKNLLNKSVVSDMAAFKSTLDLAYDEIVEAVGELNQSLLQIPYTDQSYVQLNVTRSKDVDVREFNNMLKNSLKTTEQKVDLEESFNQIKKILDRMKKDGNWCKEVTDVRNWAEFYVLELALDNKEQRNYFADSSGLSGGQKAKLAFTILASAIAYQYGLQKENAKDKSFRFIVIDEAFSKSDDKNSRYAMTLFHKLGLQFFVITPKDKIYLVEPFVKHVFLTHINEQQNDSRVSAFNIKEFYHDERAR